MSNVRPVLLKAAGCIADETGVRDKGKPAARRGRNATGPIGVSRANRTEETHMRSRNRNNRRGGLLLAAVALTALMGGSAFTASNTQAATDVVGYGETTVSGAVVNSLTYNLNAAGDNVDTVELVLDGDTTGSAVAIGFNGGATTSCGTGTFTTVTTYTCDDGGANFVQSTSGLTKTAVVVN